ncbi:MAG: putative metal-binding motif-containing protein, partial [Deltaproteobacteria bacterium]|nr:putative metal-binding motif-containing protein [Deltaproteobacteria bacterium]
MPFALTSAALLTLLLGGCDDEPPVDDTPVDTGLSDADGDSWTVAGGDCDDTDPSIHPGVDERCNGRDDDCDGSVDEDDAVDATAWYADADGDEYGDPATLSVGCTSPEAYIADGTDCDDADPSIHPGAEEVVADGVDQDCDGGELCYQDTDWDGYGTSVTVASPDLDCADPGEAQFYTDCDDGDALVHPGAAEDCNGRDDDCSGGPAPEES